MAFLLRWANPDRMHGMPTIDECEQDGWMVVGIDPRYPSTRLMRKDEEGGNDVATTPVR